MPDTPHIPTLAELPARPRRIVLHWTAGAYQPNAIDLEHYHYLVTGTGEIVRGRYPVAANMRTLRNEDRYAAHTGGLNSYSVGVAFCGMMDAVQRGAMGPCPLTEEQVRAGLAFVARLCHEWEKEPLNANHLHTHYEAWTVHGVKGRANHLKWDIAVLPWARHIPPDAVGDWLRSVTADHLMDLRRRQLPDIEPDLTPVIPEPPPLILAPPATRMLEPAREVPAASPSWYARAFDAARPHIPAAVEAGAKLLKPKWARRLAPLLALMGRKDPPGNAGRDE